MPTVAYFANLFPSPVEPYVVEEIRELRRRGVTVIPCSARKPQPSSTDGLSPLAAETLCLFAIHPKCLLRAGRMLLSRAPVIAEFLACLVFESKEPPAKRIRAIAHTFWGLYLASLLRPQHVEHIHVHHGYFGSWIVMVAARLLNVSFSMTLHGSDMLLHPAFLDVKLARCSFCVTISEFNRRSLLETYPQVDPLKIVVCHLGVPEPRPFQTRQENQIFSILSVGRAHPVKNHAFLIQACWLLTCRGHKVICRIAGGGPELAALASMIRDFDLQQEIFLLGQQSPAQLDEEYARADLMVCTSLSEGIPLVLMEAMVRGRPVLAPGITGISELVIPGKTGFLYQSGSLDDFLQQIAYIRANRKSLAPVLQAGREHVLKHFNRETNVARVCDLFVPYLRNQPLAETPSETTTVTYEDPVLQ